MPAHTHTSSPYGALSGEAGVIPMSLYTLKSAGYRGACETHVLFLFER